MQNQVSQEVAEKEVNQWLLSKKVSDKKIEENQGSIDKLIEAVQSGTLSIDPTTNVITHHLGFPVGKDGVVSALTYKPRLTQGDVRSRMKNVAATDGFGILHAYACALTEQPAAILDMLDTSDYSICQTIATFFL